VRNISSELWSTNSPKSKTIASSRLSQLNTTLRTFLNATRLSIAAMNASLSATSPAAKKPSSFVELPLDSAAYANSSLDQRLIRLELGLANLSGLVYAQAAQLQSLQRFYDVAGSTTRRSVTSAVFKETAKMTTAVVGRPTAGKGGGKTTAKTPEAEETQTETEQETTTQAEDQYE
jgi:hypothetical protein